MYNFTYIHVTVNASHFCKYLHCINLNANRAELKSSSAGPEDVNEKMLTNTFCVMAKCILQLTCWGSLKVNSNYGVPLLQHVVTPQITMAETHLAQASWQRPEKTRQDKLVFFIFENICISMNYLHLRKTRNLCFSIFFMFLWEINLHLSLKAPIMRSKTWAL